MLIVQITDTHIKKEGTLAYGKIDTTTSLIKCINHVNKLLPKPDIVVFTGDITDSGSIEEYNVFKEIVKKLKSKFYVIPGNHDNCDNLKKVFNSYKWFLEEKHLHFILEDLPLCIIGLDSTSFKKPYGELCKNRLSWLENKLNLHANKKVLIFMHHPPVDIGIEHMDIQNLCLGKEGFKEIIKKHNNIVGIACGHVHRSTHTLWANTIVSTAASSSHQVVLNLEKNGKAEFILEPPSVQLHYFKENSTLVTHTSFIGDFDGPHPFYDKLGELIQ